MFGMYCIGNTVFFYYIFVNDIVFLNINIVLIIVWNIDFWESLLVFFCGFI